MFDYENESLESIYNQSHKLTNNYLKFFISLNFKPFNTHSRMHCLSKTYGYNSQRTHWADVAQEKSGSHSQSPVMIAEPQHHYSPQLWWKYIISNHTCQGGPLEREE